MMESPKDVIITAVKKAAEKTSPGFEEVLEAHLRKNLGKGFEIAYDDPKKFKDSLRDLFGKYSSRLFELIVINEVIETLNLGTVKFSERPKSLEELIDLLNKLL